MRKCVAIGEHRRKSRRKRKRNTKEEQEEKEEVPCKQINTRRGRKLFGRFCEGGAEKGRAMQVVYT